VKKQSLFLVLIALLLAGAPARAAGPAFPRDPSAAKAAALEIVPWMNCRRVGLLLMRSLSSTVLSSSVGNCHPHLAYLDFHTVLARLGWSQGDAQLVHTLLQRVAFEGEPAGLVRPGRSVQAATMVGWPGTVGLPRARRHEAEEIVILFGGRQSAREQKRLYCVPSPNYPLGAVTVARSSR
jgi:hypothetical protein